MRARRTIPVAVGLGERGEETILDLARMTATRFEAQATVRNEMVRPRSASIVNISLLKRQPRCLALRLRSKVQISKYPPRESPIELKRNYARH